MGVEVEVAVDGRWRMEEEAVVDGRCVCVCDCVCEWVRGALGVCWGWKAINNGSDTLREDEKTTEREGD